MFQGDGPARAMGEDQAGRRYWIYREGLIGDGRGGVPEWYLHGLFG